MVIEIEEIKDIRRKLGITQSMLAKRSGVSQSLIAKIEAGRLDPTYTNATKIFNALNELKDKKDINAEQIMNGKIISITPLSTVKDAIKKMRDNGFSQLPVIDEHKAVGIISESIILDAMMKQKASKVDEIMDSSPPVISFDTTSAIITNLLRFFQMVLVSKKGKLIGTITKTDLLAKTYGSN